LFNKYNSCNVCVSADPGIRGATGFDEKINYRHLYIYLPVVTIRVEWKSQSIMFDPHILPTGVIIFVARICDVSIGTIRTIVTVQGKTAIAYTLAIVEISIWVTVVSAVINPIKDHPLLVFLCIRICHRQRGEDHGGTHAGFRNDNPENYCSHCMT